VKHVNTELLMKMTKLTEMIYESVRLSIQTGILNSQTAHFNVKWSYSYYSQ